MRAIIIDDKDAKDLLRRIDLERVKRSGNTTPIDGGPVDDAYSLFKHVLVVWLQDQGCKIP